MAYDPSKMSLLGPAAGGMLWSYQTPDAAATVKLVSYFLPIWQTLDVGDRIHVAAAGNTVFFDMAITGVNSGAVSSVSSVNYA
jgi:hypothetical protein